MAPSFRLFHTYLTEINHHRATGLVPHSAQNLRQRARLRRYEAEPHQETIDNRQLRPERTLHIAHEAYPDFPRTTYLL